MFVTVVRLSVVRCKHLLNPHDRSDIPGFLSSPGQRDPSSEPTQPNTSLTAVQTVTPPRPSRTYKSTITTTSHWLVRGRGGVTAVLYEAYWDKVYNPPKRTTSLTAAHKWVFPSYVHALVFLSANSQAMKAPELCGPTTASPRISVSFVASADRFPPPAPTSVTRPSRPSIVTRKNIAVHALQ